MKQTRLIVETKATKSDILNRLAAAFETKLHYLKRDHRDYLWHLAWAKEHGNEKWMIEEAAEAKQRRETLREEARRLRWIACDRSLSERRRADRAKARWEARNSQSNRELSHGEPPETNHH